MAYPRPRFRRRRQAGVDSAAPRPLGCLWPIFWLILIIVLLGLLFGGYRKGTKVGAPEGRTVVQSYSLYPYPHVQAHPFVPARDV